MIDWRLYRFMNWSVVISGFLYWNLILDKALPSSGAITGRSNLFAYYYDGASNCCGRHHHFAEFDLYPIFDLCGRAITSMSAIEDQAMGGLIMWVLAGLVEAFGVLYALGTFMRLSAKNRLAPPKKRAKHKVKPQSSVASS